MVFAGSFALAQQDDSNKLSVFHAGSLSKAMADIGKAFTAETGTPVALTGSGSGATCGRS